MSMPNQLLVSRVLRRLAKEYPNEVEISCYPEIDTPECHRALFYLADKKLIEAINISPIRIGQPPEILKARINAESLEYLNGHALSSDVDAERAPVLDAEAFRAFLTQEISRGGLPVPTRRDLNNRISAMSSHELNALALKLIRASVRDPNVLVSIILELK